MLLVPQTTVVFFKHSTSMDLQLVLNFSVLPACGRRACRQGLQHTVMPAKLPIERNSVTLTKWQKTWAPSAAWPAFPRQ
jgi:hypothetical protein